MTPQSNQNSVKMTPEQLQESMKGWIQSLFEQAAEEEAEDNSDKPPSIAKTFASLMKDERMRMNIAQTLAKAAPALLDEKCMGVQLSVYVPPPMGHKNAGQMPNAPMQGGKPDVSIQPAPMDGNGQPSWLSKILGDGTGPPGADEEKVRRS